MTSIDAYLLNEIPQLNLDKGIASYAQRRIILDQLIRFNGDSSPIYNIPFQIHLSHNDIDLIFHSLECIVKRHQILRTRISIDNNESNMLNQCVVPFDIFKIDWDIISFSC